MTTIAASPHVGPLLREWRRRRHLSQLDLALDAGVSPRHVSFVETGRSRPSADMVLHLAEHLDVPLRERNRLLLAAGYAPRYGQRGLDEPDMEPVRDALEQILRGHEPSPALVVDRHWGLVAANRALGIMLEGVDPALLEPPVNVLRVTLHPDGVAPRIANLAELRDHALERLRREALAAGDPALTALHDELAALPGGEPAAAPHPDPLAIAVPLRLVTERGELTFLTTIATFGRPTDVTVAELAIESFFPADAATAAVMRAYVAGLDR